MNKDKIVTIIVSLIVTLNTILTMLGYNPIPYSEDEIYVGISSIVAVCYTVYMWWKNNKLKNEIISAKKEINQIVERAMNAEREVEYLQGKINHLGDILNNGNEKEE